MSKATSKAGEWVERLTTAGRYLEVQYDLMSLIVGDESDAGIPAGFDAVRRARVAYSSIPPLTMQQEADASKSNIDGAIEYLETSLKIKKNEALFVDWLKSLDEKEVDPLCRFLEQQLALKADPQNDLYVFAGSSAAMLRAMLEGRGYRRLLDWAAIAEPDEPEKLDERDIKQKLSALPDMLAVKPQNIWYLDFEQTLDRKSIVEQVTNRVNLLYVNRNTTELMGELWTRQLIENLPSFVGNSRSLMGLQGAFKGYSAIILGAGPSLESALDWLKTQEHRPLVLCAFKALKALALAGVKPDIVVCLDPKQKTRHLGDVDLTGVAGFAVEAGSSPGVVGSVTVCPLLPYLGSDVTIELARTLDVANFPIVGTDGSAVHAALQLAAVFGCTDIALAGADFGFPDNRLYATGAGTGDKFTVAADGKSYARQPLDSHFRAGVLVEVEANDGSTIGASLEMVQFKAWTEKFIANIATSGTEIRFVNFSRRGAVIAGAPFIEMSDFGGQRIDFDVKDKVAGSAPVAKVNLKGLADRLLSRAEKLRALEKSCRRALELADRGAASTAAYDKVIKAARKCPEVSTLLTKQLIAINEHAEHARTGGIGTGGNLLPELVRLSADTAAEMAMLYAKASRAAREAKAA